MPVNSCIGCAACPPCVPAARCVHTNDQPERLAIFIATRRTRFQGCARTDETDSGGGPLGHAGNPSFEPPMATVATTSVAERAQCHEHVRFEAGDLCFVVARTRARHRAGPREEGESQGRARRSDESRLQRKNGTSRVIRKPCWNARELPQRAERRVTSPEAMLCPSQAAPHSTAQKLMANRRASKAPLPCRVFTR